MNKQKAFNIVSNTGIVIGMNKNESFPDFWERMKQKNKKEHEEIAHDMLCFARYCLYKGDCRNKCCNGGKESKISSIIEKCNKLA